MSLLSLRQLLIDFFPQSFLIAFHFIVTRLTR
jgi:hypothetical protein